MNFHSYSPQELAGYGAFPLLIAGVLLLLRYGLYKEIGGVMSPFKRFHRPKKLKLFMKSLILLLLGVFVMVQFVRLPLFVDVFHTLIYGSGQGKSMGFIAQAGLFTAMLLVEFVVFGYILTYILCYAAKSNKRCRWSSGFYMNTLAITALAVFPTIVLIYEVLLRNHTQPQVIQAVVSGASAFEWAFLSLYPLYVVVMFFPYLNMRLRGYPLRNMMLVQALMAVSAPVYLRGIRQAVFSKKPVTFITTREAHQSELKKRLHTIIAPQTISFAVFFLTGTLVMQRCLEGPVSPIAWIIVFWTFIHTVSLGHFFLFSSSKAWETHVPEALP
jgi:hypothetical protein